MSWFPDALINYPPAPDHLGLVVRPIFSGSDPGILTVQLAEGSLTLSGSFTGEAQPTSSTVSAVAYTTASITLQSANSSRRGWALYNDSNKSLFLKLGSGASTGSWTLKIIPKAFYELPYPFYDGEITGYWSGGANGSGQAMVTELIL